MTAHSLIDDPAARRGHDPRRPADAPPAGQSAASVSIELSTVVAMMSVVATFLLALLSAMVGVVLMAIKREIRHNDTAQKELKDGIKAVEATVNQHTASLAHIVGLLEGMNIRRPKRERDAVGELLRSHPNLPLL